MDIQTGLLGLDQRLGGTVSQELIASEIPLPDGRDASEVLHIYARASVDNSECVASAIRVSGRLTIDCACRSLSGEIYGFSAQSTFLHTLSLSEAAAGHTAHVRAQVVECAAEPGALSLKLNAVLELSAFVSAPVTTPFVTGVSGGRDIERRTDTLHVRRARELATATLRLREEADAAGVTRILVCHGAARVETLTFLGASTCEAVGSLFVSALAETDEGTQKQLLLTLPLACSFDAPFMPDVWATASVESLSVAAADVSFGVIDAEAVLKLTLYGAETAHIDVLLDAYAPDEGCVCRTASLDRLTCAGGAQKTFTLKESVLIPEHLPDASRMVYATAMPVVTGLFDAEGHLGADVMLLVGVLYCDEEGKLVSFTEDIPVQIVLDAPFTADAQLFVTPLSVAASGAGRAPELTFTLEAFAVLYGTEPTALVSEIVPDDTPCPYGGVLVYCADVGETLWDVGKRFRVPLASLADWNAELADPLSEGQPVVLMR